MLTVRDLLETWVHAEEQRADIGAGAKRHYKTKAKHVARVIGEVRLDRLDLSTLERYRDTRLREPVKQERKIRKGDTTSTGPRKGWTMVDTGRTSAPRTARWGTAPPGTCRA